MNELRIDRAAVRRYLGLRVPDERSDPLIEDCAGELQSLYTPRTIMVRHALSAIGGRLTLADALFTFEGADIARHLAGCGECALMAATLGVAVDRAITKYQVRDMARAVTLDACASAAIESVCDAAQEALRAETAREGLYLTARFSPGYGDWPLSCQKDFLALLDAPRRIGLCASGSRLLIPLKSVTAVIGLCAHPKPHAGAGCAACSLRGRCAYQKQKQQEGMGCGYPRSDPR